MNFQIILFLIIPTTVPRPSFEYPVGADTFQSDQEPQKIAGIFTMNKDSSNSFPLKIAGQDRSLLRSGGDEEGGEGEQDSQDMLSPEAADTMRKINPLTIADQVSNLFRKGGRKANLAKKSGGSYSCAERNLLGEQSESLAQAEVEDSPVQPGYVRPVAPRIVSKPRSNDYGYSMILLAGDAVHLPIRVQGKNARSRGKSVQRSEEGEGEVERLGSSGSGEMERQDISRREEEGEDHRQGISKSREVERKRQGISRSSEAEEEEAPKKEVRVYKQFSKSPEFPLYDEDFNYVPDPFHGLLDRHYQSEMGKESREPASPAEDLVQEDGGVVLHRRARSDEGAEGVNPSDNLAVCGSWGNRTLQNLNQ